MTVTRIGNTGSIWDGFNKTLFDFGTPTCPSDCTLAIFFTASTDSVSQDVTKVTWNGTEEAIQIAEHVVSNTRISIWYLNAPTTGVKTLENTYAVAENEATCSVVWLKLAGPNPIGDSDVGTTQTDPTGGITGDLALSLAGGAYGSVPDVSSGHLTRWYFGNHWNILSNSVAYDDTPSDPAQCYWDANSIASIGVIIKAPTGGNQVIIAM